MRSFVKLLLVSGLCAGSFAAQAGSGSAKSAASAKPERQAVQVSPLAQPSPKLRLPEYHLPTLRAELLARLQYNQAQAFPHQVSQKQETKILFPTKEEQVQTPSQAKSPSEDLFKDFIPAADPNEGGLG